jgi:hypothetical protein
VGLKLTRASDPDVTRLTDLLRCLSRPFEERFLVSPSDCASDEYQIG